MPQSERKIVYGRYLREKGQWIWEDDGTYNELQKTIDNLQGHIRRLEKSNQELGEELQRCCNKKSRGWNKNIDGEKTEYL